MGGRRIDDHAFWAGRPSKGSVFPEGAKTKDESSADGSGRVSRYEDTTDAIKSCQEKGASKIRSQAMKDGYRQ